MVSAGGANGQTDPGTPIQALCPVASSAEDNVGQSAEDNEAREVREAQMEDGRVVRGRECSRSILEFLRTMDVGRKVPTEKATKPESS